MVAKVVACLYGLLISPFTFCDKFLFHETVCIHNLAGTSQGSPVESNFFHFQQVFGDGCHSFLQSEDLSWLVLFDQAIYVCSEILWFAFFLNDNLRLLICFECWPFSRVPSQVFPAGGEEGGGRRGAGSSRVPFPILRGSPQRDHGRCAKGELLHFFTMC